MKNERIKAKTLLLICGQKYFLSLFLIVLHLIDNIVSRSFHFKINLDLEMIIHQVALQ